jgi:hypothetical protein
MKVTKVKGMNEKTYSHQHSTNQHPPHTSEQPEKHSLFYRVFEHPVSSRLTIGDILFQGFFWLMSFVVSLLGKLLNNPPENTTHSQR